MLSVRGVYENGEIKLNEKVTAARDIQVIVTFLEAISETKDPVKNP